MDLQITKTEAKERLKGSLSTYLGVIIITISILMIACKIYNAITRKYPDFNFSVGTEILPMMTLGYALFVAKPSLLKGMLGMLLPKK